MKKSLFFAAASALALIAARTPAEGANSLAAAAPGPGAQDSVPTTTPIKHLVVIFDENVSYDHYFATYPKAANPPGETPFVALPDTPESNNLANSGLLTNNPNFTNTANGADAAEPFRLDLTQAATADQNHAYTAEQLAYDGGKADLFPKYTGKGSSGGVGSFGTKGQVMGYFDGDTVTALWNYAQHFAMSDAAYTDSYGPSTPGALEVASGQINGAKLVASSVNPSTQTNPSYFIDDGQGGYTIMGDVDPAYDICSNASNQIQMLGRNVGDLLNDAGLTWGSFMGGFRLDEKNSNGTTGCKRSTHSAIVGENVVGYIPHHAWFQYYASTANPKHERPSSLSAIGYSFESDGKTRDPANHEYGLSDLYAAVKAGNFPSVSYVKMPAFQDGHAGYSDPLDEQTGVATLVNFLERQPDWKTTAVVITWDDSDGWYDHAFSKAAHASFDSNADRLDGPGKCGSGAAPDGVDGKPVNGRCGPGTRLPFLVISPWAKANYISHTQISLSSVPRFIEDNWLKGERIGGGSFDASTGSIDDMFDFKSGGHNRPVFVNPQTGAVIAEAKAP